MRIFLLLCLLPCISSAQSWNITAQGGGLWNSKSNKPAMFENSSPISGIGAVGLSYRKGPLEAGLSISYRRYAFRIEGDGVAEFDPLTGQAISYWHLKAVEKWPALAVAPFFKYHLSHKRLDYYAGIMPAYLSFDRPSSIDTLTGHATKYGPNPKGWAADVLAGVEYKLAEAIGIFVEGSGGIVNRPWFQGRAWVYTTSLQLGIRVKIGTRSKTVH